MKSCNTCGELKSLDCFRKERNRCRSCESKDRMAYVRNKLKARIGAIESYRRYHAKKKASHRKRDYKSEYRKYRERKRVRAATKNLIKRGLIREEKSCRECGAPNPHVHHLSYDRPDNITWLCRPCHTNHHRLTESQIVERFNAAIRGK